MRRQPAGCCSVTWNTGLVYVSWARAASGKAKARRRSSKDQQGKQLLMIAPAEVTRDREKKRVQGFLIWFHQLKPTLLDLWAYPVSASHTGYADVSCSERLGRW